MNDRHYPEGITNPEWWAETMQGVNPVSIVADDSWPRLMANLDQACKGEQIGIQAILETLSRVQLAARLYLSAHEPERFIEPMDECDAYHDEVEA